MEGRLVTTSIYTGIGSRETPFDILVLMTQIAGELYDKKYILRSGCAEGADTAFEEGATDFFRNYELTELYIPWPGFGKRPLNCVKLTEPQYYAYEIAKYFHPRWDVLTPGGRMLHARNVHQIYGKDVRNPVFSDFVICWTEGGKGGGGTGQALRIAKHHKIPIYDLYNEKDRKELDLIL